MFQYAAFWAQCKANNISDITAYYTGLNSSKLLFKNLDKSYKIKPSLFKNNLKTVNVEGVQNFDEFPLIDNINITGFMQFPEYFKGYESEIKQMFNTFVGKRIKKRLGIHLRLGDYLFENNKKRYFTLSTKDIIKCLKIFDTTYNEIIVFSNDNNLAKTIIPNTLNVIYDDSKNEVELLQKMSSCEYFIASNSTLSWWACFLGEIPNVCIHYPWMKITNQDSLYLPNWKKFT